LNNKPDLAHGVYRVSHSIVVGNARIIAESDLIFLDDGPYIVLEWGGPSENQYPDLKVKIDRTHLSPPNDHGYCVYNGEIVNPRRIQ
jgi:hypothetical protein